MDAVGIAVIPMCLFHDFAYAICFFGIELMLSAKDHQIADAP
jgi:hypothetical protein